MSVVCLSSTTTLILNSTEGAAVSHDTTIIRVMMVDTYCLDPLGGRWYTCYSSS